MTQNALVPDIDDRALSRRQQVILDMVQSQGFATLEALARHFNVSTQTIRRDVIHLDEAQLLQRFHGGAGLPENRVRLGHAHKRGVSAEGKEVIASAVAEIIPKGASVFLDVGTTVEAVARALRHVQGLRIFTCSLAAAMILAGRETTEVFVTGGLVHGADGSLVGDVAMSSIARFKFDYAVIGCSGFDDDGAPMDFDMQKVAVKQAVLSNSRQAIIVADASKFARTAIVRIAPLSAFRLLITDTNPSPRLRDLADTSSVDVIVTRGTSSPRSRASSSGT